MTELKLHPGYEVYRPVVEEFLTWMPDWLHQDEFDRKARERRKVHGPFPGCKGRLTGWTYDTFILGGLTGTGWEIELLQCMVRDGLVEIKGKKRGHIRYRAAPRTGANTVTKPHDTTDNVRQPSDGGSKNG